MRNQSDGLPADLLCYVINQSANTDREFCERFTSRRRNMGRIGKPATVPRGVFSEDLVVGETFPSSEL